MTPRRFSSYFSEPSNQKYIFYLLTLLYVVSTSCVVIIEPFLSLLCNEEHNPKSELEYENVLYTYTPCSDVRYPKLLFFTKTECLRGRHLLMAVFLGSMIGYERRSSDRPAGIRTMALVSLGSALFTINSTFGFLSGPMSWDASRVSAAIPSGVGFLGGGLIVKSSEVDPITGERHHLVQGITTAAATWLSAAVGIACGGGMYFVASFSAALNLLLLRFGPRTAGTDDDRSVTSRASVPGSDLAGLVGKDVEAGEKPASYGGTDELEPLKSKMKDAVPSPRIRGSLRNRATLL
mmetsp:Transcript_14302/g.25550  ORF Transcript_14302/g.25550 Transcript_14302/m.25550 type:complete len:293 (-) Transcript_14302:185-1063(-)|eukprot:CAMPEP_0196131394 /NCGR_PEP_ID=MMETSP0910-20130528/1424_1 /TAXON_ID=49265 /ORGANISM="Thalassiosira rotula, Strain GSO102" /LENGTH=292 /DNA_ID=CAMNT_0041390859 /DNA_START=91 /DNA_END=969 /DNA_ORIENTATION=+